MKKPPEEFVMDHTDKFPAPWSDVRNFYAGVPEIDRKPVLRKWESLKPHEIGQMEWDNQSCLWTRKVRGKKKIATYNGDQPITLRPAEFVYLCSLHIDLFGLIKSGQAWNEDNLNDTPNA